MDYLGKIGIVTVTYNSKRVLDKFLLSLGAQTYKNFVLYAVDSGSQDSSVEQLNAWNDERLRIIPNVDNIGIAAGDNQGIRAALADGCDYVLLLNNDIEFEPETLAILVTEQNALDCDLLVPKIFLDDRIHIWSAGGTFSILKGYFGSLTGLGEMDRGQYDKLKRIYYAPGCCILIRSIVFETVGMIDEKYFVYYEDADFLFRVWRLGLTMFYTPRARIFHKASTLTGGIQSAFSIRYCARGHVYFMLKNLGFARCCFYLPAWQLRMALKLISGSMRPDICFIRERAFFEGIKVWLSSIF
jgi:GT2 family glycosyltransferase